VSLSDWGDISQILSIFLSVAVAIWQTRRTDRRRRISDVENILREMARNPDQHTAASVQLIRDELCRDSVDDGPNLRIRIVGLSRRFGSYWHKRVPRLLKALLWLLLMLTITGGVLLLSATTGAETAEPIARFVGPLAAVIIGTVGLKYLFGDQRSLAGFISFLLLGILAYALILFGEAAMDALGQLFWEWAAAERF
jgi:hypothetical protein